MQMTQRGIECREVLPPLDVRLNRYPELEQLLESGRVLQSLEPQWYGREARCWTRWRLLWLWRPDRRAPIGASHGQVRKHRVYLAEHASALPRVEARLQEASVSSDSLHVSLRRVEHGGVSIGAIWSQYFEAECGLALGPSEESIDNAVSGLRVVLSTHEPFTLRLDKFVAHMSAEWCDAVKLAWCCCMPDSVQVRACSALLRRTLCQLLQIGGRAMPLAGLLPTPGVYYGTYAAHGWEIVRVSYATQRRTRQPICLVEKITVRGKLLANLMQYFARARRVTVTCRPMS